MTTALENSFKSRLRNIAREKRLDPAQLWQNLVLERFLVRLSHSSHSSHFILKGGVLLSHYVELNRYTQDLDFLVQRLSNEVETLEKILSDVINVAVDDGFRFADLKVNDLPHPHMKYPGVCASMVSFFGKTRFPVNIDLGFGDVVTPTAMTIPLTHGSKGALLESEVKVTCYPKEFIFAEKLETIIYRGANNSRMKDFHDLRVMISSGVLDSKRTEKVVNSVFEHRKTQKLLPITFTDRELDGLQRFWTAHLRGLPQGHTMPADLNLVITDINTWLQNNTRLCASESRKERGRKQT